MSEILEVGPTGNIANYSGYGLTDIARTAVPAANELGYAHGCICRLVNGTGVSDATYINIGTNLACNFQSSLAPALRAFAVPLTAMRVWDALQTSLPGTAASDDLGITTGSFKTSSPILTSIDFASTTTTAYARFAFPVPASYSAGQPINLAITAYANGISGTSMSLDAEVVRVAAPTVDICATNAQDMNSALGQGTNLLTFSLTPTNVVVGDILDVRIKVTGTDPDTPSGVLANISNVTLYFTTLQ